MSGFSEKAKILRARVAKLIEASQKEASNVQAMRKTAKMKLVA